MGCELHKNAFLQTLQPLLERREGGKGKEKVGNREGEKGEGRAGHEVVGRNGLYGYAVVCKRFFENMSEMK